jgi:hypothetical protein
MISNRPANREWPLLLALIPVLLSVSSCGFVSRIRSFSMPEIPYLNGSVVPDSNGFALDCTLKIANDLAKIGTPSSIYYEAWNDQYPPLPVSPCDDLRLKLFVAAHPHPDYAESNLVRLTVIRTDNILEKHGAEVGKGAVCPSLDREWKDHKGWSTSVHIRICPSTHFGAELKSSHDAKNHPRDDPRCRDFLIPPINNLGDSYQEDVVLPGLSTAPKRNSDVPKIIFRVTHNAWDDRALVLDKVGVMISILNPDYEMREIVATEIADTAEEFGGIRGRNLVDALQPIAYKVDILRLLILQAVGGVFLDSKVFPQRPLDTILPENGGFFSWDMAHNGIWSGIMVLPKDDPLPNIALDLIERKLKSRFYGDSSLAITEPILVSEALDEAMQRR